MIQSSVSAQSSPVRITGVMRQVASPAPKTPTKKAAAQFEDEGSSVSAKSPRRQPRCLHCQRPRQGHPRSGCPYVDPPIPPSTPVSSKVSVVEIVGDLEKLSLSQAPGYEHFDAVKTEDEKERRRRRSSLTPRKMERDVSLASVSTITSEALGKLGQPGVMAPLTDDETEREDSKHASPSRTSRPGKASPRRAKPLRRTPTEEDMNSFLAELQDKSKVLPACGFLLSAEDLAALRPRFTQVKGLHVRVLTSSKDPDAYVVVGRDAKAVDTLFERVREDARQGGGVRSVLSAGGVGVAAGAFAMFAGLSYA